MSVVSKLNFLGKTGIKLIDSQRNKKLPLLAYWNLNVKAQPLISKLALKIRKLFVSIEIATKKVLLITLKTTLAMNQIIFYQIKLKISHPISSCYTRNQSQLELHTYTQLSLNVLTFLEKIYLNSIQAIVKFNFQEISTLIFLKTKKCLLHSFWSEITD